VDRVYIVTRSGAASIGRINIIVPHKG